MLEIRMSQRMPVTLTIRAETELLTHMCTPALPKPIPAVEAARSICARASSSPEASRAIRGRYLTVVSKAHLEKISEIGLEP